LCPVCGHEIVFWEAAVDQKNGQVRETFPCPHCNAQQTKRRLERAWETVYDRALGRTIRRAKQVPVLINYSVGKRRYEKAPDADDLALLRRIEESDIPYWFPTDPLPDGYNTRQPMESHGITHVHHFYTKRNLWVLAALASRVRDATRLCFQSISVTLCSRLVRYNMGHRGNGPLSGTLYVSSLVAETNPIWVMLGKVYDLTQALLVPSSGCVLTQSASSQQNIDVTVDYIFTDPPFGGNLMYSELNFLWEAWL
ncbi:MAG: DNA methylase, partial [Chloroflexi bacterium]|nr:DNA methylase [Chloroflexota bacterium]